MKNKGLKILLSLLIIAQSMIFQVSSPQLVLCIGDEGHIAVEVSDDRHSDNENYYFEALFDKSNSLHHLLNNNCIDISLDYHFGSSHISNKKSNDLPLFQQSSYSVNQFSSYNSCNFNDFISAEKISSINQHIAVTILLI